MRQIVGEPCAVCGERISWAGDSRFCSACERPVHNACVKPGPTEPGDAKCPECGSGPRTRRPVSDEKKPARPGGCQECARTGNDWPVVAKCDQCGHGVCAVHRRSRWVQARGGFIVVCKSCAASLDTIWWVLVAGIPAVVALVGLAMMLKR